MTLNASRCQVLHNHCIVVMQSGFLSFIENLVACRFHMTESFGNLNSVRPIVKMSCAWALSQLSSACFANSGLWRKCVNKVCFPPALFGVGFERGCAEERGSAGGGITTSARQTSVRTRRSPCKSFRGRKKPFW